MARPKNPERCGNRLRGSDRNSNTDNMLAVTAEASRITEQAKQMCAARRARSPVCMEQMPRIIQAWADYVQECERTRQPMTWGGFALAADISVKTIYRMKEGELDHIVDEFRLIHDLPEDATEYINEDGELIQLLPWSQPCQKLENLMSDQLERNCYTNKGNPAGSIFGLKARFDWQDQPENNTISGNTLVIADAEQAQKAMKMLTNVEK